MVNGVKKRMGVLYGLYGAKGLEIFLALFAETITKISDPSSPLNFGIINISCYLVKSCKLKNGLLLGHEKSSVYCENQFTCLVT